MDIPQNHYLSKSETQNITYCILLCRLNITFRIIQSKKTDCCYPKAKERGIGNDSLVDKSRFFLRRWKSFETKKRWSLHNNVSVPSDTELDNYMIGFLVFVFHFNFKNTIFWTFYATKYQTSLFLTEYVLRHLCVCVYLCMWVSTRLYTL